MPIDLGLWQYNSEDGLYYFEGMGIGRTLTELEEFENSIEQHEENKRKRIAEQNEY